MPNDKEFLEEKLMKLNEDNLESRKKLVQAQQGEIDSYDKEISANTKRLYTIKILFYFMFFIEIVIVPIVIATIGFSTTSMLGDTAGIGFSTAGYTLLAKGLEDKITKAQNEKKNIIDSWIRQADRLLDVSAKEQENIYKELISKYKKS